MDTTVVRSRTPPQAEINWDKIDNKAKFYGMGAGLKAAHTMAFHPLNTVAERARVASRNAAEQNLFSVAKDILKTDGFGGMYRGFGRAITVRIPAMATYLTTLETTKLAALKAVEPHTLSDASQVAIANGVAGATASLLTRATFNPIFVLERNLSVQDGLREVLKEDGVRGLYKGLGFSVMRSVPHSAVLWATYASSQHQFWRLLRKENEVPSEWRIVGVQATSGAIAGVATSCVSTPLSNIIQAMTPKKKQGAIIQAVKRLVSEKGWKGLYRNIGRNCCVTPIYGTSFIVSYEYIKRRCAKEEVDWTTSIPV